MVLTRPQMRFPDAESRLEAARQAPLPQGPLAWPVSPDACRDDEAADGAADGAVAATADDEG